MIPKLFMMIGIPASGKSTQAMNIANEYNCIIHSSDNLRIEMFGSDEIQSNNDVLFNELHNRIINDLKNGKNVVYDACNISNKRRKSFLLSLNKIKCHKIAVLICTPFSECLKRNEFRPRQVPVEVINRMYLNIKIPSKFEGFDELWDIYTTCSGKKQIQSLYENGDIVSFNQENSHHQYTLDVHMQKCTDLLIKKYPNAPIELLSASILHDIGKVFTKSYLQKNKDGFLLSDEAHYYNHSNVSAYESFFYDLSGDKFERALYIQLHMDTFQWNNNNISKYVDKYSKEFVKNILILHECDISSC